MVNLTRKLAVFSDGSLQDQTTSPSGYWFALHDWQFSPYKLREIREDFEGTPEVFRVGQLENPSNYFEVTMTEERQWFWFEICCLRVYGRRSNKLTKEEFRWLANRWTMLGGDRLAFMNHHGLDQFRNYITGENKGTPDPVLYTIICGGMSARGPVVRNSSGTEMVALEYFDVNRLPDPASIDLATDPRVFMACNITKTPVPGGYKVIRFPKFSEPTKNIYRDCPVPLMSTNPVYYPKDKMKWVQGPKPSPYFP